MAMTDKKRRFVAALKSGATQKEAAIAAGYSDRGAAQAGSRLMKDPDVIAEIARKDHIEQAKLEAKESGKSLNLPDLSLMYRDPKDFLSAVMNDAGEDLRYRMEAAKTLMPYMHERKGEAGKKEAKQKAAEKVARRFSPIPAPKLAVANGKKV